MKTVVRREMAPNTEAQAAAEPASRVRVFVASDSSVDRYNTTIAAEGWKLDNYNRNPVVLWMHDHRLPPLGKAIVTLEGGKLMAAVEFLPPEVNPMAEQMLRTLDAGVLGISVGFEPIKSEYNAARETGDEWQDLVYPPLDYIEQELLELSIVNVGGNAAALPDGRSLVQRAHPRTLERIRAGLAPRPPAPAPLPPPPPAAEPRLLGADELNQIVREVVREVVPTAVTAAVKRRMGRL